MKGAVFRAMLLSLLRDRGALTMTFLLPVIFMLILAQIFVSSAAGSLSLRVALADETQDAHSTRLVKALHAAGRLAYLPAADAAAAREMVRSGDADIALVLPATASPLDNPDAFGPAPFLILSDPAKGVAVPMLSGAVREAYFGALPDVALGNIVGELENNFITLTAEQKTDLQLGLADLQAEAEAGVSFWSFAELIDTETVLGRDRAINLVAYSAGAMAVMFLLLSAAHGAISLLEELDRGIVDRIMAGPGSGGALINGKFLYLTAQGLLQAGVIFTLAWLVHDVDLPGHLFAWLLLTCATSLAAAGLGLGIICACRTRKQAISIGDVSILIASALGGSMMPRFLMPPEFRAAGWLTPNAWAIEGYNQIFWYEQSIASLWYPCAVLLGIACAGWALAHWLLRRRMRL